MSGRKPNHRNGSKSESNQSIFNIWMYHFQNVMVWALRLDDYASEASCWTKHPPTFLPHAVKEVLSSWYTAINITMTACEPVSQKYVSRLFSRLDVLYII